MYDQAQGLTGRYHNTTLTQIKIIQALYYKPGASRARIQKLDVKQASAEASESGYRLKHKTDRPKKAGQYNDNDRKA